MALVSPNCEEITEAQDAALWSVLSAEGGADVGQAARERLAAGLPIYFREPVTPAGQVIKQYPDGRRELVTFDRSGERLVRAVV